MSNKRLFFALWPTDRQRERLRDVISPVAKSVEGVATVRGNWHVTLAFVGEFPEEHIPELLIATGRIEVEPFRLRFDRIEFWPRPKLACLVSRTVPPGLTRLVDHLSTILSGFGIKPESFTYRPHITVATRAKAFETQQLAQPAIIECTEFALIEAHSHAGTVTYRPVKQ